MVGRGDCLVRHIISLQSQHGFKDSKIIVIIENNYGGPIWGETHAAQVKRANLVNVTFARREKSNNIGRKPGVYTSSENKLEMFEMLRRLIEMKGLRFSKIIVSVGDIEKTADDMVHELIEQLRGFKVKITMDQNDPMKPSKRLLSGKIGPAGKDDLVDCLAMCLYWPKILV